MAILNDYRQFQGRHWETGTVGNAFAYRGFRAPHTGRPYSEALLLGVSGGAVVGYFSFAYEGYPPQARLLTRNTFDPWDTMLSRLGVAQAIHQTAKPERAVTNLVNALDEGLPAIVWADMWSLPYNALAYDRGMWAMFPVLVYGYDEAAGVVHLADRARVGLTCTAAELAAARGRVKQDKHRLITLEAPDPDKLAAAVSAGIWDCLRLYTEAPPKGSKNNFGLAAYHTWVEMLTKPKARLSWERVFPAGQPMFDGLTSAFSDIAIFGKEGGAERGVYADFLDEAGVILGRPALSEAAPTFRAAAGAWDALGQALLPDEIAPFGEARALLLERHSRFLNEGNAARPRMEAIDARLAEIRAALADDFPLTAPQVEAHRAAIAAQVMAVHDIEAMAVAALREAMAGRN
jgi:hypothetical protein